MGEAVQCDEASCFVTVPDRAGASVDIRPGLEGAQRLICRAADFEQGIETRSPKGLTDQWYESAKHDSTLAFVQSLLEIDQAR